VNYVTYTVCSLLKLVAYYKLTYIYIYIYIYNLQFVQNCLHVKLESTSEVESLRVRLHVKTEFVFLTESAVPNNVNEIPTNYHYEAAAKRECIHTL